MPLVVSLVLSLLIFLATVVIVQRKCRRVPALGAHRGLLLIFVLAWAVLTVFDMYLWTQTNISYDGTGHEQSARAIASRIRNGHFPEDASDFYGNGGYRHMLAVFYTATNANPAAIYAINACFGFFGLLNVLEAICITARVNILPRWTIWLTFGLPSALLWLPLNLKEGMVMFGIGTLLQCFASWQNGSRLISLVSAKSYGVLLLLLLRPHICLAWVASLTIGTLVQGKSAARSITISIISIPIGFGSLYAFQAVNPTFSEEIRDSGIGALDSFREHKGTEGTTAMGAGSGGFFNFASGLNVVLFSSLTHAGSGLIWMVMGIEGTACTLIALYHLIWRRKFRFAKKYAIFISCLVSIIFLAFFLGSMYNMGLAVRQRLQAVPAILVVAILPALLNKPEISPRR